MHCIAASQRDRVWVDLEIELEGEPDQTQEAQRIVTEGLVGDRTQHACLEVVERARHGHQLAIGETHGDRIDGQITAQQVGGDAIGRARDVDLALLPHHAPRAMALGQRKDRCARRLGIGACGRFGIPRGDEVPVGQRPAEQHVTHSAANQPEVIAGHGRAYGLDRTRQPGIQSVTHPTTSRSPRSSVARTPQMIS